MKITTETFKDARDSYLGWCSTCQEFTREATEPDAESYDCPVCAGDTVTGAENALITGKFEIGD